MPGGDRTGPEARGPMTGRALGYCAGNNNPGFTKDVPRGRGYGRGFGRGFGGRGRGFWRRDYYPEQYYEPAPIHRQAYPEQTKDEEKRYLEDMVKSLESDLKDMKKRLEDLDKEK